MGSYCEVDIQSISEFSILILKNYQKNSEKIGSIDFNFDEIKTLKFHFDPLNYTYSLTFFENDPNNPLWHFKGRHFTISNVSDFITFIQLLQKKYSKVLRIKSVLPDYIKLNKEEPNLPDPSENIHFQCLISNKRHCNAHTIETDLIFVIGSASEDYEDDIRTIMEVLKEFNLTPYFATRDDREKGLDAFCDKICSKILQSRFCIALMNSPRNSLVNTVFPSEKDVISTFTDFPPYNQILYPSPNVWYEIGVAVGTGNRIIPFFRKTGEKTPFDVQHLDLIFYADLKSLEEKLRKTIPLFLAKPIRRLTSPQVDKTTKLYKQNKDSLIQRFMGWFGKKYPSEYYLNPEKGKTPDSILICIIPNYSSENLIDLTAEYHKPVIKEKSRKGPVSIESSHFNPKSQPKFAQYLEAYHLLQHNVGGRSEIIATPKKISEYNQRTGSELIIHPSGEIFLLLNYFTLDKVKIPRWTNDEYSLLYHLLFNKKQAMNIINREKESELFGTPVKKMVFNNLEDILKILCFPFHSDCKEKITQIPVMNFYIRFILPGMLIGENQEPRKLYEEEPFFLGRYYVGDNPSLIYDSQFDYSEIPEVVVNFENYILGFFHEKHNIS